MQFCACLADLRQKANSVSILSFIFSINSINFNVIRKLNYVPTRETLCNRFIFIKSITRFQISKCLAYSVWTNWFKIYMAPVIRSSFDLIIINPFETAGLGDIYIHIFAASMGMLQIFPLILENSLSLALLLFSQTKFSRK